MRKSGLITLNCLMALIATLAVGVTLSFKFLHLEPLSQMVSNSTSQIDKVVENLDMYCYSFFAINGFVLFIALCSTISTAINRKSCYLVLMVFVFLTAIVLLVILGFIVGIKEFGGTSEGLTDSAEKAPLGIQLLLTAQRQHLMVVFIIHIAVHLILLITTGIVTTVIYCRLDTTRTQHSGSSPITVSSRKTYLSDRRHLTSQSFHYEGFHERVNPRLAPTTMIVAAASQNNLDAVQDRKLPTLPNNNFQFSQPGKLDPAFVRSAPNLARLNSQMASQSTSPYAMPNAESTSGESGEHNEKSPLIRMRTESTVNHNYGRRKLCTSMTEEEILRPENGDLSRSPHRSRKSPIRSISEADAFVSSLSNVKPPKVPPRPHERQKSTGSSFNVSFNLDPLINEKFEKKNIDEEVYENRAENKQLCNKRLITVPEPSEADEDSMGYTKIKEEEPTTAKDIEDQVCHV